MSADPTPIPSAPADPSPGGGRALDDETFRRTVELHRASLHAHCYRMLGSAHDADDALQDALLRAWRARDRFEGRSAPRTWLHRIATNVCLDALARPSRRVLPIDYGPSTDPRDHGRVLEDAVWVEPYPVGGIRAVEGDDAPDSRYEARESMELAFIAALQHLPARQRAVLILRDVLGFPARETAAALDTTTASVNSALQRARRTMEQRIPDTTQQACLRSVGDAAARDVVHRFIDAMERGDVEVIVALLARDVRFAMPPHTGWCRGQAAVADSWLMPDGPPPRLRCVPTWANAQPAVASYLLDPETARYLPLALDVFALRSSATSDAQISEVIAFRMPAVFRSFDLPATLP